MGEISCPLCCEEKFDNRQALKYHLLSTSVNIFCPVCNITCDNISELIEHLSEDNCYQPKNFVEEKLDNDENKQTSSDGLYVCCYCNMTFNSIVDHISTHHSGQEVLLEMESDNPIKTEDSKLDKQNEFAVPEKKENELVEHEKINFDDLIVKQVQHLDLEKLLNENSPNSKITIQYENNRNETSNLETTTNLVTSNLSNLEVTNLKVEETNNLTNDLDESQMSTIVYKCSRCEYIFDKLNEFYQHKCKLNQTSISDAELFECNECNEQFVTLKMLSIHKRLHKKGFSILNSDSNNEQNKCEKCDTVFATHKSLQLHKRMHNRIPRKSVPSPVNYDLNGELINEKDETKKSNFINNEINLMKTDSGEMTMMMMNDRFECVICNKELPKKYEQIHMNTHTNQNNNYICNVCNKQFFSNDNLTMHMRAHSENLRNGNNVNSKEKDATETDESKQKKYACVYCDKKFFRPHEKVKHERIHTGEKPHECDLCGKTFRVNYCLTLHMRTHTGLRPYQCTHCPKRFKSHSSFSHHILIHSEEKKYRCEFCSKSFKTSVQLAGHKNSHTKPFSCEFCNRRFASLYAWRSHIIIHKEAATLKYSCSVCGASYARNFALKDHMRDEHNVNNETK